MSRMIPVGILLCLVAVAGRGDVTFRYSYDIKPGPAVPPQAAEAMKAQFKTMMESGLRMQLKGNRAFSNAMGIISISDFDGEMITLINAKQSQYATAQKDEYLRAATDRTQRQMSQVPEAARQMFERMKVDVQSEKTGRTLLIYGIQAEERKATMTMGIEGMPAGGMRMVMSFWTPTQEEMNRNPMLAELLRYTQRAYQGTDPGAAVRQMFAQNPAMATASKFTDIMKDSPVLLRMNTSMFAPNSETPIMEMAMDLQELSAAEVPESAFRIPREYTAVSMAEALAHFHEQFVPKPPAAAVTNH